MEKKIKNFANEVMNWAKNCVVKAILIVICRCCGDISSCDASVTCSGIYFGQQQGGCRQNN